MPDHEQSLLFLNILKKTEEQTRVRAFLPTGHKDKKQGGARKGFLEESAINRWQEEGRGVYLVVNNGGDSDKDITECVAFFCEWDDRPKVWQVSAWKDFGLPEPTVQVDTGGKSIHSYWVLTETAKTSDWLETQKKLLDYLQADPTVKNLSRVMRLPGAFYVEPNGNLGEMSKIINFTGNYYSLKTISDCLPDIETQSHINKSNKFLSYEASTLIEIENALSYIPPAVPKTGQYPFYRNLFWALIKACRECNSSIEDAKRLMKKHSPNFAEIDQCAVSGGDQINAGTFWYWAKQNGYKKKVAKKKVSITTEKSANEDIPKKSKMPFKVLGSNRGVYYYLPQAMRQVVPLTSPKHNKYHLNELASLDWWSSVFGDENGRIDWDSAKDSLISACQAKGVYSPSRIRGRGTWIDAGRVLLHLGNRLVIDGLSTDITKLPQDFNSFYDYECEEALVGPSDEKLSDQQCQIVSNICTRFQWETPVSAELLLGWICLAPLCGTLDWRPHVWITGGAGTGKTSILKLFIKPLMGGMVEGATGGTTEAGLRGKLKSDAIPIVFDELEQNDSRDKQVVQNILSLARIASSEGGKIYKGTSSGGSNIFEIRSMFCVSSINVNLIQKADLDRFCVLQLISNEKAKGSWTQLETEIRENCSIETGQKLLARTISLIPQIIENSKAISIALSRKFGRRYGDQFGTLLAGAHSLKPGGGGILTVDSALKYLGELGWDSAEEDKSEKDEYKCLNLILQSLVSVEGGKKLSILELLEMSSRGVQYASSYGDRESDEIESILGRYGIRFCGAEIAISNNSKNLQLILKDTPWSGNAYRTSLRRVTGAYARDTAIRFKGSGLHRATMVPYRTDLDLRA